MVHIKIPNCSRGITGVAIHGGAFWPVDSTEMDIAEGSKHDFKLTPYLDITNFQAQFLDSNTLTLTYQLNAPIDGIPDIDLIQPYVNTTKIVCFPEHPSINFSDQMKDATIPAAGKAWADFTDADKTRTDCNSEFNKRAYFLCACRSRV